MEKLDLLEYLDLNSPVDADDVAVNLRTTYEATAMALLRLVRQDLAARYKDPDTQLFVYELTPKGEARLEHFLEDDLDEY